MKRIFTILLFLATTSVYAQDFVDTTPDWYNNPPQSNKKYYGVGMGESKNIDIAEQKALLEAKTRIAEQVEPAKVKMIKKTSKSKSGKTNEDLLQQKIVEAELTDIKVLKKVFMQKGDLYTAYVLIEMKRKK